jgi:hypothetical protein
MLDPLILRAAFGAYFPFRLPSRPQEPLPQPAFASPFPPMETLSSSHALTALAARKRAAFDLDVAAAAPAQKRQRGEDPLDLSQQSVAAVGDDVDVDVLSVDTETDPDPDRWTVDQVVAFVGSVDTCQDYAEVSYFIFFVKTASLQTNALLCCDHSTHYLKSPL